MTARSIRPAISLKTVAFAIIRDTISKMNGIVTWATLLLRSPKGEVALVPRLLPSAF
jgi:hypothetical protein